MFFPMYAVIICSVKTNGQVLSDPFGIPHPFDLTAFGLVLGKSGEFWGFLYNSIVIAVSTIVIVDLLPWPPVLHSRGYASRDGP